MENSLLDLLQLVFGVYVLFFAIMGKGKLYELKSISESNTEKVRKVLRKFYFALGSLMTVDGLASVLRYSLFELQTGEDGKEVIIHKAEAAWLSILSYDILKDITMVCFVLEIIIIISLILYVRKKSKV